MTALCFRYRKARFRITSEHGIDAMIWVLEREGAYSAGSGLHVVRHCWTAPRTPEGLSGLIVAASQPW